MTPRSEIAAAIAETISAHNDPMQAALAVMAMIEPKPLEWKQVASHAFEAVDYGGIRHRVIGMEQRVGTGESQSWLCFSGVFGGYAVDGDANAAMEAVNANNRAIFWASTPVGGGA